MRLDLDFLRNLLLKIDSFDTFGNISSEELVDDNTTISKINAYLDILTEEDLIETMVEISEDLSELEKEICYVKYITLKGQRLIDNIKNKTYFDNYIRNAINNHVYSLSRIIEYIINT